MSHNRLKFFLDRIGKRVFRNETTCKCLVCKKVAEKGLIIQDEMHAHYLHDIEAESEGEIKYRDKK